MSASTVDSTISSSTPRAAEICQCRRSGRWQAHAERTQPGGRVVGTARPADDPHRPRRPICWCSRQPRKKTCITLCCGCAISGLGRTGILRFRLLATASIVANRTVCSPRYVVPDRSWLSCLQLRFGHDRSPVWGGRIGMTCGPARKAAATFKYIVWPRGIRAKREWRSRVESTVGLAIPLTVSTVSQTPTGDFRRWPARPFSLTGDTRWNAQ